jgi:DNA-binding NarL/FixJ family response regulator
VRGLICDDHPLMRQAFFLAFHARWPNVALAEAASYPEAWEHAAMTPDFCVLDLAMPGAEPLDGVKRLRAVAPAMRIAVLTGLSDDALLNEIAGEGVAAILPKTLDSDELLDRLAALLSGLGESAAADLPPRQREVLRLLGEGLTNKEIALRLGIAPATVKVHVSRLIEQLGAANRTDAVSKAQRSRLI